MVGVRSPPSQNTLGTREQRAEGRAHAGDTRGSVPGRRRGARDPRPCHPRGAGSPSPGWALPPRSAGRESSERGWGVPIAPRARPAPSSGLSSPHIPLPAQLGGPPGPGGRGQGALAPLGGRARPGGAVRGRNVPLFRLGPCATTGFNLEGRRRRRRGGPRAAPSTRGAPRPPKPRGGPAVLGGAAATGGRREGAAAAPGTRTGMVTPRGDTRAVPRTRVTAGTRGTPRAGDSGSPDGVSAPWGWAPGVRGGPRAGPRTWPQL